jgi:hypothetical protein
MSAPHLGGVYEAPTPEAVPSHRRVRRGKRGPVVLHSANQRMRDGTALARLPW